MTKKNKDLMYNHPAELWLPFESILIKYRMLLKAYIWTLAPLIAAGLIVGLGVWYCTLRSVDNMVPISWLAGGDPINAHEWPTSWISPDIEDALTAGGYRRYQAYEGTVFVLPRGEQSNKAVLAPLNQRYDTVKRNRSRALWFGLGSFLMVFGGACGALYPRILGKFKAEGRRLKEDQHIRGGQLLPLTREADTDPETPCFDDELCRLGGGDLPLIDTTTEDGLELKINLPDKLELTHMLFLGSSGAGKTQSLLPMLKASVKRGTRNIVYDVKGDFTAQLFKPEALLFAPFDARSVGWCPFADIEDDWDCKEFATILCPDKPGSGDSYFVEGSRQVLAAILIALRATNRTNNADLLKIIHSGAKDIYEFLSGVEGARYAAQRHLSPESEKQAAGIMGSLGNAVDCLDLLKRWQDLDANTSFSFRDFIKKNPEKTLIMQSQPEREAVISPLLSAIYNIMFKASLGKPETYDIDKRALFWFDELAQLSKMDSLVKLLQLGRSKNTGIIAALQDFGTIRYKYGKDLIESLLNNFTTLIAGRLNETEILKWLETRFGKEEFMRFDDGHSFGPSDFSDRLTANRKRQERNIVFASEIATLPPLNYYYLVDAYITKANRKYYQHPEIAPAHVPWTEDTIQEIRVEDFGR